jgi:hypothetical protein
MPRHDGHRDLPSVRVVGFGDDLVDLGFDVVQRGDRFDPPIQGQDLEQQAGQSDVVVGVDDLTGSEPVMPVEDRAADT